MRRGNEPSILRDDAGRVVGVNLSADFCAEHEWGIKNIKRAFGISDDIAVFGMPRRKITEVPTEGFRSYKSFQAGTRLGFAYTTHQYWDPGKDPELRPYRGTLSSAWSGEAFGVLSSDPQEILALATIHDAIMARNVCIFLGGARLPVFEKAGLVIAIADRMPADVSATWEAADRKAYELKQYEKRSGLAEHLRAKGCEWFYLGAKKMHDGSVKWWLNPEDQEHNNSGWFTEQELRAWGDGKGPVVMTKTRSEEYAEEKRAAVKRGRKR